MTSVVVPTVRIPRKDRFLITGSAQSSPENAAMQLISIPTNTMNRILVMSLDIDVAIMNDSAPFVAK